MSEDISVLAANAAKGDARSFASLYGIFAGDLYRFALYMLKNVQDAEDAVQEACLSAYGSMASLRKPESFKSWIFTILSNICKTKLSARGRLFYFEDFSQTGAAEPRTDDLPLRLEISQALDTLSDEERQIVLLHSIGGYTSEEIAGMIDCPSGTVRSKLSRAHAKLRRILSEEAI